MSESNPSSSAGERIPTAVIFDCDGVLIESVDIKTDAFIELFSQYPDHHAAIAQHHQEHLGISRFAKFAWIYRELLGHDLSAEESELLGNRFSALVFDSARTCPAVPGAEEALIELSRRGVPLYVASGTPQEELEALLSARGWSHLFREIHGSPTEKPEIIARVLDQLSAEPNEILFVGDGWSDHQAALETGVRFVLRETTAQAERFATYRGPRIADLWPLTKYNLDF